MTGGRPLNIGIVGAGPAGIYAADILARAIEGVRIDLLERLPAPFGLVRYGVAPDHPHIKQIIGALHGVMDRGEIRLLCNVDVGTSVSVEELHQFYDALIFSTGSDTDAPMSIPGVNLPECFGAADFVSWYDGHPDAPRDWPLNTASVAVIGNGNVALDVSRILAKHADDLLSTEIPDNVHQGLNQSAVTDVHVFGRRGPAQSKFSPLELRELGRLRDVDIIVDPEDIDFDDGSQEAIRSSNQTKQVVKTLTDWAMQDEEEKSASRRIHLHFFASPVEVLGDDHVTGLRTERTRLNGDGTVSGTGEFTDWPVGAVYRAVGYFGSPIPGLPFDERNGVIPNVEGRITDTGGKVMPGLYATGWIKRGPVGLIGNTKSDAQETIAHLVEDVDSLPRAQDTDPNTVLSFLNSKGLAVTDWSGYRLLDAYEQTLGQSRGRDRIKVVPREEMTRISRGE